MRDIASFDVFDTLLTRAVGSPGAVFLLLGRWLAAEGLVGCTPEAFARARAEAERLAYDNAGAFATLDHIYRELRTILRVSEEVSGRMRALECELEARLIRGVPKARDDVARVRARGCRVVFLSDMYLPPEFVRARLAEHGFWDAADACYVSCEYGAEKATGHLFRHVLRREAVTPSRIRHHGNDLRSDIAGARRAGVRAHAVVHARLNRYEHILESHTWATEGLSSAMAGASRLVRLNVPAASPREEALRGVAAGVMGPTLVGFVLWVLHRAIHHGLQRLYFVSRDGQVLLDVGRALSSKLRLSMDLRYLHGSRQAWNLAGVTRGDDRDLAWAWDNTDVLSVRSLLSRLSVRPEEVGDALAGEGLESSEWATNLDPAGREALRRAFRTDRLQGLLLERAAAQRRLVRAYLEQEGVAGPTRWGVVDLGWFGSLQTALAAILRPRTDPLVGFYFGLAARPTSDAFDIREGYFFDNALGLGFVDGFRDAAWVPLLEMFCAADHGPVVGFAEEGGRIRPILDQHAPPPALEWGLPLVRRSVQQFVDSLVLDPHLVNPWTDIRGVTARLLRTFWASPSRDEAAAWATFPWEDGFAGATQVHPFGVPYGPRRVIHAMRAGRVTPHFRAGWVAGSLAITPHHIRIPLHAAAAAGRLRRWAWGGAARVRERVLHACFQSAAAREARGETLSSLPFRLVGFVLRPRLFRRILARFHVTGAPPAPRPPYPNIQ